MIDQVQPTRQPSGRPSGWRARVTDNRRAIDLAFARDPEGRTRVSSAILGLTNVLAPALQSRARGDLLDAGCGTQPFRPLVEPLVDRYLTFDIEARVEDVDYIGDVEDMAAVPGGSIDTLLCSEVLEHVPHPQRAVGEFARVLRPGGALIVTVPFLARLHEEPHDYFRYTRHGLRRMLVEAGFEVDEITETGSLCSFVAHQVSVGLLGLTWHVRPLRRIVLALNDLAIVRPAVALDRLTSMSTLLPLGYVVVATRQPSVDRS